MNNGEASNFTEPPAAISPESALALVRQLLQWYIETFRLIELHLLNHLHRP